MSSKGTVLIVEDNPMNLNMAKELLELSGFSTLEAEDAETGVELAKQFHPNLILMDLHLPTISGYEASEALKADPLTKDITIVAFTALVMKSEHEEAIHSGCSGVIVKPINVDHFADTVAAYL